MFTSDQALHGQCGAHVRAGTEAPHPLLQRCGEFWHLEERRILKHLFLKSVFDI